RRLQLNFSDVFKSGISFDKIDGELVIDNGQLTIVDDLTVASPSSGFYMRGDADLVAKQLDMELIVTLPVANNLPWIVALAGGLPTAAGVYVASKIFEKQVDSFSSAIYDIDGDWNNPEIKFKQVFGDGKKAAKEKREALDKAVTVETVVETTAEKALPAIPATETSP
ncbi:MAG: hypothetical protein ACJAYG_002001, partial [Oceanicoccus sp.]